MQEGSVRRPAASSSEHVMPYRFGVVNRKSVDNPKLFIWYLRIHLADPDESPTLQDPDETVRGMQIVKAMMRLGNGIPGRHVNNENLL